jgi:hypothetical protein
VARVVYGSDGFGGSAQTRVPARRIVGGWLCIGRRVRGIGVLRMIRGVRT